MIFPLSISNKSVSSKSGLKNFHESAAAQYLNRQKLLVDADNLCHYRFSFLNLPLQELGNPVKWDFMPNGDRLWQYNLHYGEWALTLCHAYLVTKEERFLMSLINLIDDWIEHNPVGKGAGWEPYPISRRLPVWSRVGLSLMNNDKFREFWESRLEPSLHQQTKVLASNLEFDLSNNHLIANYKALAWMGMLFPHWNKAEKWKSTGLDGLWAEMRRQVLADGVHNERSISYHTIVLQDILETWMLCKATGDRIPDDVLPTLKRMIQFLADMQAPDGSYPMLNDTVPGYPINPKSLLLAGGLFFGDQKWIAAGTGADVSYAAWLTGLTDITFPEDGVSSAEGPIVYPDAGYAVLKDDTGCCLYFDAGPMGPEHLPGHGHADALSLTLYGKTGPLIVDPGVYSYHDSGWRNYFRSTAAHNTIAVDGQDQCVFWGNFRVAYAPKAHLTGWSSNFVSGVHEGYKRLKKSVFHSRRIDMKGNGTWEVSDTLEGKGEHDFVFTLQLSPGASVKILNDEALVTWPDGTRLKVIPSFIPCA